MRGTGWVSAAALAVLVACGGEEGERVDLGESQRSVEQGGQSRSDARAGWTPALTARVDSANAAYAAGDYEQAAAIFTALTEEQPELGVAWFGLSMAERAMGNDEAADAALAESEARSPGLGRVHEAAVDSASRDPGLPQGHPGIPAGHPPLGGDDSAAATPGGG